MSYDLLMITNDSDFMQRVATYNPIWKRGFGVFLSFLLSENDTTKLEKIIIYNGKKQPKKKKKFNFIELE